MKDLNYYKEQIKQKRKQTDFRDFLKELGSWLPFVFYKNNGLITRFPLESKIKVIHYKKFEENRDNLVKKGFDYDFKYSFFKNFKELYFNVEFPNILVFVENENSDFSDPIFGAKNSYLSFIVGDNAENILYSVMVYSNCVNVINSLLITNSQNIFSSVLVDKCFNIFYSKYLINSNNIWFSSNLVGCSECIFCNNLENQSYCINNKKLDKEEYFKQKEEILKQKDKFNIFFNRISKKGRNLGSKNVNGNAILFSENIENGYLISRIINGRNVLFSLGGDNSNNYYDCLDTGINSSDFYGVFGAGYYSSNLYCSMHQSESSNIFYSILLENCSYCIGCIGLKNKSYCILNKQYSKEEWEKLACKIFEQMEQEGTLGDFFPASLNPFYFNDTVAGLIGGFKKEEVVKEGFMWRDEKIKVDIPDESIVVEVDELDKYEGFDSSGNWQINPEILKKVIKDKNGDYYRIVKMEYDFLVKHGLPLPRLHWLERMKVNFGV